MDELLQGLIKLMTFGIEVHGFLRSVTNLIHILRELGY